MSNDIHRDVLYELAEWSRLKAKFNKEDTLSYKQLYSKIKDVFKAYDVDPYQEI